MGYFNFIETFFFISLGITFVLILLLVYHFKQRMNELEQKCDTMFDIINNVVKELTILRSAQPRYYGVDMNNFANVSANVYNSGKVIVSDVDDEDDSAGPEDEDNSSGSEFDTEDEDEDEDEDGDEDEDEDGDEAERPQKTIKIVNVNINDNIDIEEIAEEQETNDDHDNDNEQEPVNEPFEVEEIHVEKVESNSDSVEHDETSSMSGNKDVYRKMTLPLLKALVITKGLCSDAGKLKKPELLKLLEEDA